MPLPLRLQAAPPPPPKGQIHLKLIQAKSLAVKSSLYSRPYVVVQFEQNEFISRDPIPESDKEIKGTPTILALSSRRSSSSSAVDALNDIRDAHERRASPTASNASNSPSASPSRSTGLLGLFGRLNAHNPVWKHQVSFDVTDDQSQISFNVYDRSLESQGFLGRIQIKPVLVHEHSVDQWFPLRPIESENITGSLRIQITYTHYTPKHPAPQLTPSSFQFLKLIGRGTFGKVFQVRKKDTHRIYAMKVLSKKEIIRKKEVEHTIGEKKITLLIQAAGTPCPFLVGLKFSFQTERELYLITDFKSGGELFWHLQRETRFTEDRAKFYVSELILALEHLHKFNIIYRDLKPENILLDATGHVSLCDFGLSKSNLKSDELTQTFCGTTEYLAPEILLDEAGYGKIVDFWSLGVLLFEMCCGWSPFYAEDVQMMYKNICFGKVRFPKGVICEEGKAFVKALLNRNPKHRLGAHRDAEELKDHIYFKTTDWEALARKAITPPFKPVVESDESTSNFDPEFTEADIKGVVGGLGGYYLDDDEEEEEKRGKADPLDDDDPSEQWVEKSLREGGHSHGIGGGGGGGYSYHHWANGPLGSDRLGGGGGGGTTPTAANAKGIEIKRTGKKKDAAGVLGAAGGGGESPLTKSVQENFRGFTYHGGESVGLHRVMASRGKEEGKGTITEEEYEDFAKSSGRYSSFSERRKAGGGGAESEPKVKKVKKKVKTVGFIIGDENARDELGDLDVDGMVGP